MLKPSFCVSSGNIVTGATVNTGSPDSSNPPVNLHSGNLYEYYGGSTYSSYKTVEVNLDTSKTTRVVSLLSTTLRPSASLVVSVYKGVNLLESKTVSPYSFTDSDRIYRSGFRKNLTVVFDSDHVGADRVRVVVNDSTVYPYRVGELWVGSLYQPEQGPDYGSGISFQDLSTSEEAFSGTRFYNERPLRKALSLQFETKDFKPLLYELGIGVFGAAGSTKPVLAFMDPTDPAALLVESLYGTAVMDPIAYSSWQAGGTSLTIMEQL